MAPNDPMVEIREVYVEADPNRGNVVILKERPEDDRFFLMFVGDLEFTAIAKEKGLVEPKRPLTHDLYLSILERLQVEFLRVEIHEMREETYHARVFFKGNGIELMVDSRPSDALALALNRRIPVFVRQSLFRRKPTAEQIREFEAFVKTVRF